MGRRAAGHEAAYRRRDRRIQRRPDQSQTRLWRAHESLPGLQDFHGQQGQAMDSGKRFRLHHHRRSDRPASDVATQSDDADHIQRIRRR